MSRILTVSALIAVPLLCAELYFRMNDPGRDPGVYLEAGDGQYTLSGYAADQPTASGDAATRTPVVPGGPAKAFYIVGPPDSPLAANARTATLWCFVVDDTGARFRADAMPVPATITQINPRAHRVTSDELGKAWGPESVAFQAYQRALARTAGSRTTMAVMIGLEVQDSAGGPRRMYSVRVGPPE